MSGFWQFYNIHWSKAREEFEKAVQEAEECAEKDKEYQEKVQTKNNLDQLIHQTEKLFDEHGGDLNDEDKQAMDSALDRLTNTDDYQQN